MHIIKLNPHLLHQSSLLLYSHTHIYKQYACIVRLDINHLIYKPQEFFVAHEFLIYIYLTCLKQV